MSGDATASHGLVGHRIGGETVTGRGERLPIINPATEAAIGELACATPEDVVAAVDAARGVFESGEWRGMPVPVRQRSFHGKSEKYNLRSSHRAEV